MIYAPQINAKTFLHFFWKRNGSCRVRDYSRSRRQKPYVYEEYKNSIHEVKRRTEEEIDVHRRPDIGKIAFWHEKTLQLNAEYSDEYPELLQK